MLDAKRLLDKFLSSQAGNGFGARPGRGFDQSQLQDLARGIAGGFFGGGALAGGLAGILLGSKKGRKLGGAALKIGGMALVGALGYKAYRDWQAGKQPTAASAEQSTAMLPPPGETPFNLTPCHPEVPEWSGEHPPPHCDGRSSSPPRTTRRSRFWTA